MSSPVGRIAGAISSSVSHLAIVHTLPSKEELFTLVSDSISRVKLDADLHALDLAAIYASATSDTQGIFDDIRKYFEAIAEDIKKNSEIIYERIEAIDWNDKDSILSGFSVLLDYLKPIANYVAEHPWILLPLVIPAFEAFLFFIGFRIGGIVPGSLASKIHSIIGNVEKGSLFAFLQSVGAEGWAFEALGRANMFITIAVIIVAAGELLIDKGVIDPKKIKQTSEGIWIRVVEKFDQPPPTESVGTQLTMLNLNHGWVRYGVLASLVIPLFVCAGEGL